MTPKENLGADAAAVETAGPAAGDAASHAASELVIAIDPNGPSGAGQAMVFAEAHGLEVAGLTNRAAPWMVTRLEALAALYRIDSTMPSLGSFKQSEALAYAVSLEAAIGLIQKESAAPELYEACKEFVRKCECGEASSRRSYAQMKAALDKADGRKGSR